MALKSSTNGSSTPSQLISALEAQLDGILVATLSSLEEHLKATNSLLLEPLAHVGSLHLHHHHDLLHRLSLSDPNHDHHRSLSHSATNTGHTKKHSAKKLPDSNLTRHARAELLSPDKTSFQSGCSLKPTNSPSTDHVAVSQPEQPQLMSIKTDCDQPPTLTEPSPLRASPHSKRPPARRTRERSRSRSTSVVPLPLPLPPPARAAPAPKKPAPVPHMAASCFRPVYRPSSRSHSRSRSPARPRLRPGHRSRSPSRNRAPSPDRIPAPHSRHDCPPGRAPRRSSARHPSPPAAWPRKRTSRPAPPPPPTTPPRRSFARSPSPARLWRRHRGHSPPPLSPPRRRRDCSADEYRRSSSHNLYKRTAWR